MPDNPQKTFSFNIKGYLSAGVEDNKDKSCG